MSEEAPAVRLKPFMPLMNLYDIADATGATAYPSGTYQDEIENNRADIYGDALDRMELNKISEATTGISIYEFRIYDTNLDGSSVTLVEMEEYKKVYMPFDGEVFYYPSGSTLPNGITATEPVLRLAPSPAVVAEWKKNYHPHYSGMITEMYLTHLKADDLDSSRADLSALAENLVAAWESDRDGRDAFVKWVLENAVGTPVIVDADDYETLVEEFINAMTTSAAGAFGIFVESGTQIAETGRDAADSNVLQLNCMFSNSSINDSDGVVVESYNDALTAQFLQYRQRIPDPNQHYHTTNDRPIKPLVGHPMIVLIEADHRGYDTSNRFGVDQAFIEQIFKIAPLDFLDYTTKDDPNKFQNRQHVDPESHPANLFAIAEVDTTTIPVEYIGDWRYYFNEFVATEDRKVYIYNPDTVSLIGFTDNGYVDISIDTVSDRTDYSLLSFKASSRLSFSSTAPLEDRIEVQHSTSALVVFEFNILVCEFRAVPIQYYSVDTVTKGGGFVSNGGLTTLLSSSTGNEIFGHQLNIWFYQKDQDEEIEAEVDTADDIFQVYDSSGSFSTEMNDLMTNRASGASVFNVYGLHNFDSTNPTKGKVQDKDALTTLLSSRVRILFKEETGPGDIANLEAHEAGHACQMKYSFSSSEARHFDHDGSAKGDYELKYNFMNADGAGPRLTAHQAKALSKNVPR